MGRFDLQPRKPKKGSPPPTPPPPPPSVPSTLPVTSAPKIRAATRRPVTGGKSFMRGFWRGALVFIAAAAFVLGAALISYAAIAAQLPLADELEVDVSSFQSLRIVDREGNLLTEAFDPNYGRRTRVPIE